MSTTPELIPERIPERTPEHGIVRPSAGPLELAASPTALPGSLFEPGRARRPIVIRSPFPAGYLAALVDGYPEEIGVPTCAEDAAETILSQPLCRPRERSRYARTVNPALAALSPDRQVDLVAWAGLVLTMIVVTAAAIRVL